MELDMFKLRENSLVAELNGSNFMEMVGILNDVAEIAEALQHHPNLKIYDYKNLQISITTHDEGNIITDKDWNLAKAIEKYLQEKQFTF